MSKQTILEKKSFYEVLTIIFVGISAIGFIIFLGSPFMGMFMFMGGALAAGAVSKRFKTISIEFKKTYVKQTIEGLVDEANYDPKLGFTKEEIYESGVLLKQDRFHSEDMLSGSLNKRPFRCADVHLQDVRSNGKSTTVVTIFKGRYYEILVEKPFKAPIHVLNNNTTLFGKRNGYPKIELEWVEFNKKFDVYSSDEFETFKLLKPVVMEKILALKQRFDKLLIGFVGNKIILAINNNKDAFDLRLFHKFDDSYVNEIKQEFNELEEIINTLEVIL
ncbi:MAG: DUF3137 domain-containing protein [Acholeplasma sp.]|nr:DUF3137 domain-containing protein [Acholeplasma sp.]